MQGGSLVSGCTVPMQEAVQGAWFDGCHCAWSTLLTTPFCATAYCRSALISSTPEFESYKRTFEPLWPVIGLLIVQLEALCKRVGGWATFA